MARGKHGIRAVKTQEVVTIAQELERSQLRARNLANENEKLRATAAHSKESNAERIAQLLALIDAGASDALDAAKQENFELQARVDAAEKENASLLKGWDKTSDRMVRYLADTGLTPIEAMEVLTGLRVDFSQFGKHVGNDPRKTESLYRVRKNASTFVAPPW